MYNFFRLTCSTLIMCKLLYLTTFRGRSAQLRIVDASSSRWAHINVDDFRFSWHKGSGSTPATNFIPERHESNWGPGTGGCGQGQCGAHEGEDAGAAYVYRRRDKFKSVTTGVVKRFEPCQKWCNQFGCYLGTAPADEYSEPGLEIDRYAHCTWEFQQKLQPTDRRAGQRFGRTVAYEENTGTIVVGAQFSRTVNIFNEDSEKTSSWSKYKDGESAGGADDNKAGAVYLYIKSPEVRTGLGSLLNEPTWSVTERFKLQPYDAVERMGFGSADGISISDYSLVVGAPNGGGVLPAGHADGGSFYTMDYEFQHVSIPQRLVVVNEGSNEGAPFVEVSVLRDRDFLGRPLTIEYGLSDITAVGVSSEVWERCSQYAIFDRRPQFCGDYLLSAGRLVYGPADFERKVRIDIANDFCHEDYSEYIRLQLFIPGGMPLIGENYNTVIRIDDDDNIHLDNILNKDYCSAISGMGGPLVVGGDETFRRAHEQSD